jgi:hypothetical protein
MGRKWHRINRFVGSNGKLARMFRRRRMAFGNEALGKMA